MLIERLNQDHATSKRIRTEKGLRVSKTLLSLYFCMICRNVVTGKAGYLEKLSVHYDLDGSIEREL